MDVLLWCGSTFMFRVFEGFWLPFCPFLTPPLNAVQVKEHIEFATPGKIAGFFHETIQGVGGTVPLADGFLPEVYKVRSA